MAARLRDVFAARPDEARVHPPVPRYLFCAHRRSLAVDQLRTFGVLCLVSVGDCPSKVPDHEIEALKAMIDGHGFVKLPESCAAPVKRTIAIGSWVRITAGPFGGMSGLYAGQSTRERERVLLNLLGSQRPVLITSNTKGHSD